MNKRKALTIAGVVGVGVGLAVAGVMLWRKYQRNPRPDECLFCDSTSDCLFCEGDGFEQDKRGNKEGRKARS